MPTSPGQSKKRGLLLWKKITMLAASLISRELQNFFHPNKTLEIPYLYKQISKSESQPAPACRSAERSTDPFHRSTGPVDRPLPPVDRTSRPFPTESWVTSVGRPGGRPGGRPSSNLVHVVHVGRPGRSTEHLLLRAVTPRFHGYGDVTATYIRRS